MVRDNSERMLQEGQQTFRFDTFGSEAFWDEALQGALYGFLRLFENST